MKQKQDNSSNLLEQFDSASAEIKTPPVTRSRAESRCFFQGELEDAAGGGCRCVVIKSEICWK